MIDDEAGWVEAERRQLTVLFADMVGFTAFSERAGEEAAFTLMQSLAKLMEDAVREQGGGVQSFTGDGIMAVFGAPAATEDAPLRACRAALGILKKVNAAGDGLEEKHRVRPDLRIGLNSGSAVVGKVQGGAGGGVTVLGDTVNVAARLQSLAAPQSAVMSESTHRLVDGLVDASFLGERQIKGKADAQKVYRLDGIQDQATRFRAQVKRGLTRYIGRDRELEALERGLEAIGAGLQVFDIVGEPGIGKSRLTHEFLGQIVKERARALAGACTPDGRQTPFRAFIEIIRGAFRVSPSDDEAVVGRKLEDGLRDLNLASQDNLGLLLNLLGLKAPEGALEGLDGVLIGLRTRELLQQLAQARSRLTPLILVFEDLHWLDSASEELLAKLVAIDEPLQLLILHTRRPEYAPPWGGEPRVTRLSMGPLSAGETARIAEARLGVEHLPETLAKLITAKAEGNALFAEEIASFVVERGIVRRAGTGLEFDPTAVGAALPESVQTLLASRIDGLAPADRSLLQTAAVIGRRFDPDLVAVVGGIGEGASTSFTGMEALDLIRRADGSSEYEFKHALVRDALYNGLLSAPRAALHLKAAEELERRGGNRLTEIAEALAHHYAETSRKDKAFTYLAMAGDKSLDVYSIPEAEQYYRRALAHAESHPGCADRLSVSRVMVRLLETLLLKGDYREIGVVSDKFIPYIKNAGETPELTIAYFYQATSFYMRLELRRALEITNEAFVIAERLNFGRGKAYHLQALVQYRSTLGLDSLEDANKTKADLLDESTRYGDRFILNWSYFSIAWDYMFRGLSKEASAVARELVASGEARNDPRAAGLANFALAWFNLLNDAPDVAMLHADECLRAAITPIDRLLCGMVRACARILLGNAREGLAEFNVVAAELERLGVQYAIQYGPRGVAVAMLGSISQGIRMVEQHIAQRDRAGDATGAAWARITLAEVLIQILSSKDTAPPSVLVKNLWTILNALVFGASRARRLLEQAASVQQLSERGVIIARINFDLGLLSAMKKKRDEARRYFEKARAGAEDQGADKLLQKIDAALAQLGSAT